MEIIHRDEFRVLHITDGLEHDEAIRMINSNMADGINFNYTRNFPKQIDFLEACPSIKYLQLNDLGYDYSVINKLTNIEVLDVYTNDRNEIRFDKFPKLKKVDIFWRPKAKSIFECSELEHLFLGKYRGKDLTQLKKLTKLKYLRINTGSIQSLIGIEYLQELEELWLMQIPSLRSLNGLQYLLKLGKLHIDNCKNLTNTQEIDQLPSLKSVTLSGTTKAKR